jgi:hypothetical protein
MDHVEPPLLGAEFIGGEGGAGCRKRDDPGDQGAREHDSARIERVSGRS